MVAAVRVIPGGYMSYYQAKIRWFSSRKVFVTKTSPVAEKFIYSNSDIGWPHLSSYGDGDYKQPYTIVLV